MAGGVAGAVGADFPVVRIPEARRKFKSQAVEKIIREVRLSAGNKELGWLFENCFPNTLDTTVDLARVRQARHLCHHGRYRRHWLRDSSARYGHISRFARKTRTSSKLVRGVIHRQVKCVLKDPYANAFYKDESKISEWKATDLTDMKPGVHERKWEIDSLCYPIRLSHGYWQITGDTSPFDAEWMAAMEKIVQTFRSSSGKIARDHTALCGRRNSHGYGTATGIWLPDEKSGLIHSMFGRVMMRRSIVSDTVEYFALNSLGDMRALFQAGRGSRQAADDALIN